jgi:hypothetical protein
MGATDNLVRDLVNLGHVEANRKENRIFPAFSDEVNAIEIAFTFWRTHEVVRQLLAGKTDDATFTEAEFVTVYRVANKRSTLGEATIHTYAQRMLRWLTGVGLVHQSGQILTLRDGPRSTVSSLDASLAKQMKTPDFFLGEAPPSRVTAAFRGHKRGTEGAIKYRSTVWP